MVRIYLFEHCFLYLRFDHSALFVDLRVISVIRYSKLALLSHFRIWPLIICECITRRENSVGEREGRADQHTPTQGATT